MAIVEFYNMIIYMNIMLFINFDPLGQYCPYFYTKSLLYLNSKELAHGEFPKRTKLHKYAFVGQHKVLYIIYKITLY